MSTHLATTIEAARRLAVTRQRLAGPLPEEEPTRDDLLGVVRDLGCLQLDPISVVARTNHLVPWSRLGAYDTALLDSLLWDTGHLFEYWAHCASIVLTDHYPIHAYEMRRYMDRDGTWAVRRRQWIETNHALYEHVMSTIRERGPIMSKELEDRSQESWQSTGWTSDRNVNRMLFYLWMQGILLVSGRSNGHRQWDLAERVLPEWTPREELTERETVRRSALTAIRALGAARKRDVLQHFTRGRYWQLPSVLAELETEGLIERVTVHSDEKTLPGPWYVHRDDLLLLQALSRGEGWQPRTTLLSPFDNLICDRARTELLFGFDYRIEIYVPRHLRKYGYYVLPILHGDRLIGRIDPQMDRKAGRLTVNAVHAEPGAPDDPGTVRAIRGAIESLAGWLGAKETVYGEHVHGGWRKILRS